MSEVFRIIIEDDYRAGKGFEAIIRQTGIIKVQMEGVAVASQRMAVAGEENFNAMARSALRVVSLFAIMDMAMMRVSVAHSILEGTQERYDEAVKEHGATSSEAVKAYRELERVQNYVQRSYIRSSVAVLSFGVNLAIQSNVLKSATAATAFNSVATAANTAIQKIHNATLVTKIVLLSALTAGVFALAAAWGAVAAKKALAGHGTAGGAGGEASPGMMGLPSGYEVPMRGVNISIGGVSITSDEDFDEKWRATGALLKDEYRRHTER